MTRNTLQRILSRVQHAVCGTMAAALLLGAILAVAATSEHTWRRIL